MARGDMKIDTLKISGDEILNRAIKEAVVNTVDFSNVSTTDANGEKIVKAGTPINASGVPVTATPWTGAVGIILHDTYESAPQVATLKKAYINVTKAQENSGLTYDAKLITALNKAGCRIVFEEPEIAES